MDEPAWTWPAWKFGMKRSDLFTKLHDQYNTLTTPIQDPEAFHHDVYEICNFAQSKEEFHRMMAERKEQRLEELHNGLELASVKIISNPNLIGTDQWPLAIRLFRARSLDALVGYFSSYLPESQYDSDADTIDSHSIHSGISRSSSTSMSTTSTDVNSEAPSVTTFFTEKETISHEPLSIKTNVATADITKHTAPLSPPLSHASPIDIESQDDDDHFVLNHPTPASRSMSFSGSESDQFCAYNRGHDLECQAPTPSSLADGESTDDIYEHDTPSLDDGPADMEPAFSQHDDTLDNANTHAVSCTPNPTSTTLNATKAQPQAGDTESSPAKPQPRATEAALYMSAKLANRLRRSPSPSPRTRLAHCEARKSPRMRRRELSPQVSRSPCEVLSRIQKALPDQMRCRPNGRNKMEVVE